MLTFEGTTIAEWQEWCWTLDADPEEVCVPNLAALSADMAAARYWTHGPPNAGVKITRLSNPMTSRFVRLVMPHEVGV